MDIGIFYSNAEFSLELENGDLKSDESLETSVMLSLFSDQRVAQDELPQGHTSRRGYWGDMFADVEGDKMGSKLWTLDREKLTASTLARFETEGRNSLLWMLEDAVAKDIQVVASVDDDKRLILSIEITKPNDENNRFGFIWDGQEVRRRA